MCSAQQCSSRLSTRYLRIQLTARRGVQMLAAAAAALILCSPVRAQVAGQNVNMVSGTDWTNGDPFLQRQNEPSIAVSTRNTSHLFAGANDYRAVDLPGLLGISERGDAWLGVFKSFDAGRTWQSTLLPGFPLDGSPEGLQSPIHGFQAASDPAVRAGTNGLFYFVGLAYNRGTNPLSAVFISRFIDLNNKENGDASFENGSMTNLAPRDPIKYLDTKVLDKGNPYVFLDKPWVAVDIPRRDSTCTISTVEDGQTVTQKIPAGAVYVTYTAFVSGGPFQFSNILFKKSTDCGATWSFPRILSRNDDFFQDAEHQGTVIAIDPSVPAYMPAKIYVAWRRFANPNDPDDPPAIFLAESHDGGETWSSPSPIVVFPKSCNTNPTGTGCPFDQIFTTASFRSNGYPALTVDDRGRVYVAWSQRDENGDGKIMIGVSSDGRCLTPGSISPVDIGPVTDDNGNPFTNLSGRGSQLMPSLKFTAGKLTMAYYDLRQDHTTGTFASAPEPTCNLLVVLPCELGEQYLESRTLEGELASPGPGNDAAVFTPYISDSAPPLSVRRHTIDLMAAEATPLSEWTTHPPTFKSFRVSHYEFGSIPQLFADVEQIQFNTPNLPIFVDGTAPFMGDYIDLSGTPEIVPNEKGGWTFNVSPTANPVFHAAWTDNRDVIPPADGNWQNYTPPFSTSNPGNQPSKFDPTTTPPACVVGETGMRNQNIYTSEISQGVILTSPQTSKPVLTPTGQPIQREFVVEVRNATNSARSFQLAIPTQPASATASFLQFAQQTSQIVKVNAFSSQSLAVFVVANPGSTVAFPSVLVTATENDGTTPALTGSLLLNPDPTNPALTSPDSVLVGANQIAVNEFYNPGVANPGVASPGVANPGVANPGVANPGVASPGVANPDVVVALKNPGVASPGVANPGVANPGVANPGVANEAVTDASYAFTNEGNTSAAYTIQLFQSAPFPPGSVFQIILSKLYFTTQANGCQLEQVANNVILASVTNPSFVTDPTQLGNPGVANLGLQTPTLNLAPGESGQVTIRTNLPPAQVISQVLPNLSPVVVSQGVNTVDVQQGITTPPVNLVVTTVSLPTSVTTQAYSAILTSIGGTGGNSAPRTWSIVGGSLPPGLQLNPSTGAITGTPTTIGSDSFTVQATDTGTPPHVASRNLSITVVPPLVFLTTTLPGGNANLAYSAATIATTGGTPPVSFAVTSGTPPPGLTLASSGPQSATLSGTPTTAGTFTFTVTATDSSTPPQHASQTFTVTIDPALASPPATIAFVSQPQNSVGGQTLAGSPIVVSVNDATGAAISGASVALGFNGAPPCASATLSGTSSAVTGANGQATFSELSIDRGQLGYTLQAKIGNLSAVSNAFTVNGFCPTNGPMSIAREEHTAVTLADGTVLIAGGGSRLADVSSPGLPTDSAELYNPATGMFSQAASMNVPRWGHAATVLLDGRVLITGGVNSTSTAAGTVTNTAEIYDPIAHTFTLTAAMNSARYLHTATLLADGRVLIAGGSTTVPPDCIICSGPATNTAEIFDPATGVFTPTRGLMTTPREIFTATLLTNGQVLVVGGGGFANPLSSAEIFDPNSDTFSATGAMSNPREFHAAALLPNGKVLVAGGGINAPLSAEVYDPSSGTFALTGNLVSPILGTSAGVLPDGTVLLPAGFVNGQFFTSPTAFTTSAEIYSPVGGSFAATGSLNTPTAAYSMAELKNGTFLTTGGENVAGTTTDAEVYYSTAPLAPIAITTTALTNAKQNTPYTQILLEQGGLGNLTWSETGTLPAGMTFTPQGALIGTPTAIGTFPLTFTVTDSSTPQKTISAELTLIVTGTALQFTSSSMPPAGLGRFYSQPLPVAGGTQPYNATQTGGALPPGLSLSGNGVLAGTPSATGSFTFTVNVTDSSLPAQSVTQSLTMVVNSLFITTTVLPNGIVGVPYNAAISTSGGTLPLTFSPATEAFPPGLTIVQPAANSQNGALAGTPTLSGTFSFSESVTDSSSPAQTATQNYVVTIAPAGTAAPAIVSFVTQPQSSIGGQTLAGSPIVVSVTDANNTPIPGALVALSFNGAPPCSNAVLSGTLSAVTGANGQATFSNLSIDRGQFGYTLLANAGSASAVSTPFSVQGFCASGNLSTQREDQTQVLLGTGKVLVAGGVDNLGNASNTADLYDPATGTTSRTGNLAAANGRADHATAVLTNGQVLLMGGADNVVGPLNTAELYDPTTGTFTATGNLNGARFYAAAAVLADGRVLVSGGFNSNAVAVDTAEIYDPSTGLFTPTGNLNQARGRHTMTLLQDGTVLVTGGRDAQQNFNSLASAEIFNPFANQGAGAFIQIGNMNSPRSVHTATLLTNGAVLIDGGFNDGNTSLSVASAEVFNPNTRQFTLTGSMAIPRARQTSTLLPDGTVLEAGGINSFNGVAAPAPSEIYSPASGSFGLTGAMITGRELLKASLLFNGNVLVSGGDDGVNVLSSTEVYYNTVPIAPIEITTTTIPNAFVGQPYVAIALEQNGTGPITWSIVSGAQPPGTKGNTIGTYGTLSGTPTTAGTFTFTAQVTDGRSVATRVFTVNVSVATLAFTSNTMPPGGVGKPYSQPLPVTGGTLPYTATVTSGSLPPGLALSSTGVVSGTPASAGTFTFTVNVTDSSTPAQSATQTLTMTVNSLFITTTALPDGMVGAPYNAPISTSGGTLPLTFSLATAAFPPGLAIQQPAANSQTGALTGTPTLAGHYTFTESVVDSSNPAQTATQAYAMDILPAGATATPAAVTFLTTMQNSVGGQILNGGGLRVHVADANNNPVVGASVAISFNGAPPCASAVLSGTLTAITGAGGNASFTDLSIDRGQVGYTLLATAGSVSGISSPFTVNGFCETDSLNEARGVHSVVVLPNGTALVAGGFSSPNNALASAEIYNPATHSFTAVGNMNSPRAFFTMTLLNNGLVLVTGGFGGSLTNVLSSAELFDPSTNTFTLLPASMNSPRAEHVATLLASGEVLITGGENGVSTLGTAEVFDPATNTFTATATPMTAARTVHSAVLLPNGQVLVTGGFGTTGPLAAAELYDPVANTFTSTGSMGTARGDHASALLSTGKVLVAGGIAPAGQGNEAPTPAAELYNPSTGLFTPTSNAPEAVTAFNGRPVPTLPDGTVFLVDGPTNGLIYSPASGTFQLTANLAIQQYHPRNVLLQDGTILVPGGQDLALNGLSGVEIYYSAAALAPLQVTTPTAAPPGTTVFTDAPSFAAATSGSATTGFNGIIPAGATFAGFNPLVVNGINFSTTLSASGVLINVTKSTFYTPNVYPGDFLTDSVVPATGQASANNTVVITLPTPTTAFAMDFGGLGFRGTSTATITLSNGFVLPLSSLPTVGNTEFRGFVSTTPFNTITFSAVNDDFVVEDVLVANADTVLPDATLNQPYTQMLLEQGGLGTLTWTVASGSLPPGVTLRSDGVLLGTPTSGGTYTFAVHVVDSSTPQKSVTSSNFILQVVNAMVINAVALPTGTVGTPYPATAISATGGTAPVSFAVSAGTFPPGLTLAASGSITGTPTTAGAFTFTVTATDSSVPPQVAQQTFTIQVVGPLAFVTTTLPNGTAGVAYPTTTITASGGTAPVSFAVTSGTLPPGLTLASSGPQSATLSGTPTTAVTTTFTLTATDSSSPALQASQSFSITISPAVLPGSIEFVSNLPQNSIEGQVLANSPFQILVTDNAGTPLQNVPVTMSLVGPAGLGGPPACPTAVLGGTVTQNTNASGIATFGDLTVNRGSFKNSLYATVAGSALFGASTLFNVEGFCETGSLNVARAIHRAVALPNGKVLVAGGLPNLTSTTALSSAELYDPVAHSFSTINSMNLARDQFTMTLLNNGLVLIAGGAFNAGDCFDCAEIFDPSTNTFTLLQADANLMVEGRAVHTATLLSNGKVLIAGGVSVTTGAILADAEIFDPSTNTFTRTAGPMSTARQLHHAELLPNGQVLITGGLGPGNTTLASAELYDPVANTFTTTGSMATSRANHASALLETGQVLVVGGESSSGASLIPTAAAELYDPSTGTFTATASAARALNGFYSPVPTLPDGRVFLADGPTNAQLYNPVSATFAATANLTNQQTQPQNVLLSDGSILLTGGDDSSLNGLANAEIFYPANIVPISIPTILPLAYTNEPYSVQLQEVGGIGTLTWTLTSGTLPAGITLSSSGLLSGTATTVSASEITVQVTDSSNPPRNATQSYILEVIPPVLVVPTLPTANPGVAYSQTLTVITGTAPFTFSLFGGSLPTGLTLASNGTVSGTTNVAPGTFTFIVKVTDSSTPPISDNQTVFISVAPPLAITTPSLPNGNLGVAYPTTTLTTSGGLPPVVFLVTSGTLPPGLSLGVTGTLSGTPTTTGTFSFTVTAADASAQQQLAVQPYTITIN